MNTTKQPATKQVKADSAVDERQDVVIEGYLGKLSPLIASLEKLLPLSEVILFSARSPSGLGKNETIAIKQLTYRQALKIQDCLNSNDTVYVAYYGDECFYKVSKDVSDWYLLTGQRDEPDQDMKMLRRVGEVDVSMHPEGTTHIKKRPPLADGAIKVSGDVAYFHFQDKWQPCANLSAKEVVEDPSVYISISKE